MKHIKPYKIFESNGSNFPTTRKEVIQVCEKYSIENYTINGDLSIDVDDNVHLGFKMLEYLPLRFNYVSGGFDCYENKLISLEGSPQILDGSFLCYENELKSLEGSPSVVNGNFICYENELESLEGCPQTVNGYFSCYRNKLKDLEHFPEVNGIIDMKGNPVNLLVYTFINKADSFMIEDFIDYEIVRNRDTVMLDRLETFIRDNDLEMPNLDNIKEYYKIIE
jgi:hypothetical protein